MQHVVMIGRYSGPIVDTSEADTSTPRDPALQVGRVQLERGEYQSTWAILHSPCVQAHPDHACVQAYRCTFTIKLLDSLFGRAEHLQTILRCLRYFIERRY